MSKVVDGSLHARGWRNGIGGPRTEPRKIYGLYGVEGRCLCQNTTIDEDNWMSCDHTFSSASKLPACTQALRWVGATSGPGDSRVPMQVTRISRNA